MTVPWRACSCHTKGETHPAFLQCRKEKKESGAKLNMQVGGNRITLRLLIYFH